jgi:uncharacterized protein YndB with AHSA1/START domain
MSEDVVTVERVIPAPAAEVFALLADANRHPEIDGSGTVRGAMGDPKPLELGSTFGMSMKWLLPYAMKSRVIEFEPDRRIAWQTIPAYPLTDRIAAGRIWRYELEPVEGGTLVRESWDITREKPLTKPLVKGLAETTRQNMARTLERIEQILT